MIKRCITFAGVMGSSKSPIATYLSWNLGLPVFNNDVIRTEVQEDLLHLDQTEYLRRRDERKKWVIESGQDFIYDASIDRCWREFSEWLHQADYQYFVISLDLSRSFLDMLYTAKGYTEGHRLALLMQQHDDYIKAQAEQINLRISDVEFPHRLDLSLRAVSSWLRKGDK